MQHKKSVARRLTDGCQHLSHAPAARAGAPDQGLAKTAKIKVNPN
jgi:hypothetical protein